MNDAGNKFKKEVKDSKSSNDLSQLRDQVKDLETNLLINKEIIKNLLES